MLQSGLMRAAVLHQARSPLVYEEKPVPSPGLGQLRIKVESCALCRTDLHIIDGELASPKLPLILGHEIVGKVSALGEGVRDFSVGERVGVPWLGQTCGHCSYCLNDRENLCEDPIFTGYTRDGGFAEFVIADARHVFNLSAYENPIAAAPLMCAGLIGWRSLIAAADSRVIGIYGFGAAAHIITQVCRWQGREVLAFTRPGDVEAQEFARQFGAVWAGGSDETPPAPMDAAIVFAPVGSLVIDALRRVKKGGRVICGGIHMSDIPAFPYSLLWEERQIVSVANLTRRDGIDFLKIARQAGVRTSTVSYPLEAANDAIGDLRLGRLQGAAVLVPK
jgi:alcohol dehydrogenase, propanol-preferring